MTAKSVRSVVFRDRLDDQLDLHRGVQRQRRTSDGSPGVSAEPPQSFTEQLAGPVGDEVVIGERRVTGDEDRDFEDLPETAPISAEGPVERGQSVEGGLLGAGLGGFQVDFRADPAGREELTFDHRQLAADVNRFIGRGRWDVQRDRLRGGRHMDAVGLQVRTGREIHIDQFGGPERRCRV